MDNEVKIQFKNSITNQKKLEQYRSTLIQINAVINGLNKQKQQDIEGLAQETNNIMDNTKENTTESAKMAKNFNRAFNYTAIRTFSRALQRITTSMGSYISKSATYLENMNLLDVAYDNNTDSAKKFVNKLSEMYGLDESWGYRTVGIFKQLSNAMGLTAEMGDKVSETMTQFAIDVSSLYNIDTEAAVSKLQSALAGQTKPVRAFGADITQGTLQLTLDQAGIDKQIGDLTYAEKRLVIIASMLEQVKEANGDWGRTIESVANQTRIMSDQWERLTRTFGNMLLPIVQKILPYVNAILMTLTEIFSAIATFLGYSEEDYDFFGKSSESALDLKDNIDGATNSTEKLKKSMLGLRAFDKIINISTPKNDSGSGTSGTGVSGDIADLASSAMDKYNLKLDNVQMKATKIRDSIMEWLGFTKEVDEKTGKVSFKFDHITGGTVLGAMVVGGAIFKGIYTIVNLLTKFAGSSGLGKLEAKSLKLSAGISLIVGGLTLMKKGWDEVDKDADKAFKDQMLGISGLMGGFTLLGSQIKGLGKYGGPLGMLTGAFVGFFATVKNGFDSIHAAYKSTTDAHQKYLDKLNEGKERAADSLYADVTILDNGKKYIDMLDKIVDKNGKVKKGYESRAKTIISVLNETYDTEYKLNGQTITLKGKEIKSIQELNKNIDETIKKKKIEMTISAYENVWKENLIQRNKAQEKKKKKQDTYNTMLKKWQENEKEAAKFYGISRKELKASLERQKQGIDNLQITIQKYDDEMQHYDDLVKAHTEGNVKEIDKALEYYGVATKKSVEKTTKETKKITSDEAKVIFNNIAKQFNNPIKLIFSGDTSKVKESFTNLFKGLPEPFKSLMNPLVETLSKIKFYANGGLPQAGQLFVANEKGPELLGQIGGQSFVANQQQIGRFIERKSAQTQSNGNQVINIYLDKNKKLATYTLNELQSMAKSNGKPIEIGG